MGSSGEDPSKGIDASVGSLVWVRRRNGAWWPGKILGPDELPEGCVPTPRSGTPVKLLGRADASVDWYNLEKSKRVKAFHCGEYDDCIEKVKASASHLSKKAVKYARREDAILHALELESARLGKDHPYSSATPDAQNEEHHHHHVGNGKSPSALTPSEESEDLDEEDLISSGDDSDLAVEVSQSGASFDEPDHVDYSAKEESKQFRTPNDSEDDGAGVKRMRGLEDLGMGVPSSMKRKRSQVAHVQELLKKKNRRRTLTKVLECTTMVAVPVDCDQLSSPTGSSAQVASDSKVSGLESNESKKDNSNVISNNSESNWVSFENGALFDASMHANDASLKCKQEDNEVSVKVPDSESCQRLFDVPLVAEEKNRAGLSPTVSDPSQQIQVGPRAQSNQSSHVHVETIPLGNEEHNESGSTSSGTTKWRLKGKRNSRSRKLDVDDEAETLVAGVDRESLLAGPSRNVDPNHLGGSLIKSRPITEIQVEEFRGWSWNAPQRESHARGSSTAELSVPQRLLPYRQSRFTVNPKYDSSDFALRHHVAGSGLYDVTVEVRSSSRPQRVPYISLMSKSNGRPIIGHPIAIEKLKDGSTDGLINLSEYYNSSSELDYTMIHEQRSRGRPPSKPRSFHARGPLSKSPKSKRNGLLSKKTRKLSSLTGSHRLSREEKNKPVVDKLKGPSLACVPLNVVFSRINADLNSSVRPATRLTATSNG